MNNPQQIPELKEPNRYSDLINNLSDVEAFLRLYLKYSPDSIEKKEQVFAAYLTLSLHAYGIGACVVQRPLVPDKQVNDFKQHIGISEDEQIVLMIGIGMVADKISVPVSHRLSIDKVYKKID